MTTFDRAFHHHNHYNLFNHHFHYFHFNHHCYYHLHAYHNEEAVPPSAL